MDHKGASSHRPEASARHKEASAHHKAASAHHKAASPQRKAASSHRKQAASERSKQRRAAHGPARHKASAPAVTARAPPPPPPLPGDLGRAKDAIGLIKKQKLTDAGAVAKTIEDPAIQKLVEWARLRNADSNAGFERYAAFLKANPHWPSRALFRRRAEARLWQEHRDAATVLAFVAGAPASPKGRLALARVLMQQGDRAAAQREVRAVWRAEPLSPELESAVIETFHDLLNRDDHLARMDRRIGAREFGAAMRAARRVGDDAVAIVKACEEANSGDAGKLFDQVPVAARGDLGYALCRIHYLVHRNDVAGAARLMLAADAGAMDRQDTDEWWRERRTLARRLIDRGEADTAYQVVCAAATPANPYYQAEFHFMAGWIALRFLHDPETALAHFAHVDDGSVNPVVLARAAYWRGRAHEALGHSDQARAQYEAAARHTTAYYGQLARVRLGLPEIEELRPPPKPAQPDDTEVVHAAQVLYAIGERDLALSFVTDLAEQSHDAAVLAGLAALAARHGDARATLLVGKSALARGFALDVYAYPDIGVPPFTPIGPHLDRSIVYSIVRTESEFNQRDRSPAKAVGLMQVTPEAGRDTARRFHVKYDWDQLVADPVYNTQMGAAEVAALLKEYRGSLILSFAGYNAGRGRVRDWVAQYGDPRNAKVDPIDWVEHIPFAETRNYVQRVMENLQVYRARFSTGAQALRRSGPRTITAVDPSAGPAPRAVADDPPSGATPRAVADDPQSAATPQTVVDDPSTASAPRAVPAVADGAN